MNTLHSPKEILSWYQTKPELFWRRMQQHSEMAVLRSAIKKTAGYKKFLRQQGVSPAKIKTYADFLNLPPTSKVDYFRKFPLAETVETPGPKLSPWYLPRPRVPPASRPILAAATSLIGNIQSWQNISLKMDRPARHF